MKNAKTYNEEHKVLERTKQATKDAYQKAKAFDEKHHLFERTGKKLASAASFISKQLKEDSSGGIKTDKKSDGKDTTSLPKTNDDG